MEPYDEGTDLTCATNPHMSNASVSPLTTVSQETVVSTSTDVFQHMEKGSIAARHLEFVCGYTGSTAPPDQESQRFSMTPASARRDGGSTPTSTAGNSADVAKQDLSRISWRVERQEPVLAQTRSTEDFTYEHVFAASSQTGAGESQNDQPRWEQGNRPRPNSSSGTDRPLQPPSRLASSCDRCKRLKKKCGGDPKQGPCKNCRKFAESRPSAGGEAICTWNHLESSDKRYLEQRGYLPARS